MFCTEFTMFMRERGNSYKFQSRPKEKGLLRGLDVDGRIILKCMVQELVMNM